MITATSNNSVISKSNIVIRFLSCFLTPSLLEMYLSNYDLYFNRFRLNVALSFFLSIATLLANLFFYTNKFNTKSTFLNYYPQLQKNKLRIGDPLRFFIQSCYLILFTHKRSSSSDSKFDAKSYLFSILPQAISYLRKLDSYISIKVRKVMGKETDAPSALETLLSAHFWEKPLIRNSILISIFLLMALLITVPFSLEAQAVFATLILFIAYSLRGVEGQIPTLIMITLSISTSTRYLWWRFNETLNWSDPVALFLGAGLLAAETYAWLVLILGFFQTIRPLKRKPAKLTSDTSLWPTVDIYIPTYNEPLSVVKPTTIAALALDWPEDKLNVYILDDGKREEFRIFAETIGAGYITRTNNTHAKAGNLNQAMKVTQGEYIAIFDCDHVPVRSFLQMTMGTMLNDDKMCLVQTPHHFFSADPFERNLDNFSQIPSENMLFYGLIQDGNDMWDATFFCGSCAVLRRKAVDDIGGFAFETVTEDAHTALRMQRKGYKTAYINIPQAAGLATDSLSAHVGQRIRWARGMAQIFRLDNPLLGKGLGFAQRICYLNAMLHFLSGIPRIVFLTAPLALIYFDAFIIYAPFIAIFLYVVPTLLQVKITNSRIQGKYRYSFWGEVYESVLAWYILKPTTVALFNPNKGKFNVTEKGGLNDKEHYDWDISKPYLALVALNCIGLLIGFIRLIIGDPGQIGVLLISMTWAGYNLMILGAAVAVATESKQVRKSHRIACNFPAVIRLKNGHTLKVDVYDFSDNGVGISLEQTQLLKVNDEIELIMTRGYKQFSFPTKVCNSRTKHVGLSFTSLTIEQEKAFVECTFSRADAWLNWEDNFKHDRPSHSFAEVRKASLRGFKNLIVHAPPKAKPFVNKMINIIEIIGSFLPRAPKLEERNYNE